MKHILHTSIIGFTAAFLFADPQDARAQAWERGTGFDIGCTVPGNTIGVVAQTFTAPAVNPELRQIWALAEAQDGSGTDNANFLVIPWSDAGSRPAGLPVFNSGATSLPPGPNRKTRHIALPSPVMLTPGGRYAILMVRMAAPGGTLAPSSVGCDEGNPFPNGSAFSLADVPVSGWGDVAWDPVETTGTDIALQPVFTQAGPQKMVLLAGAKDGSGSPVNGSPGTTFVSFGIPAQNSAGWQTFVANVRGADGKVTQALCKNEVSIETIEFASILARKGDPVPGRPGVFFAGFKDPVITESGVIAVPAMLAGAGITSANNMGIYANNIGGGLLGVVHTGDEPTGVPGARIKSLRSFAACDAGFAIVYQMVSGPNGTAGPGGVTTATDTALAFIHSDVSEGALMSAPTVRKGTNFSWGGSSVGIVKSFSALGARVGAAGHGHGAAEVRNDGEIYAATAFQAKFVDGRTGNFSSWYTCSGGTCESQIVSAAVTGGTVDVLSLGDTATHEVGHLIGIPGQTSGGVSTYVMKSKAGIGGVSSANDVMIAGAIGEGASDVTAFARKGTQPTGGGGAAFASFMSPVARQLGDTATHEVGHWVGFMAKLAGPGVLSTNDICLSRMVGNRFAVVAREGGEAPGVPGSQFKAFTSIAFMDYTDDSCMNALIALGKMRAGLAGTAGPGGVTTANDEALWLFDHNGDGHLAFREGEQHFVGGVTKTVKKFIVLPTVPFSPSQTRSHNAAGRIVLRAIYTDGTCGIIAILIGL